MKRFGLVTLLCACATTGPAVTATKNPPECPAVEPTASDDSPLPWAALVAKVCVLDPGAHQDTSLLELVKEREGQKLEADWLADELRELVGTGFVREVKAIASPAAQNAVLLTFVVKRYPLLGKVSFVAAGKVDVAPSRGAAINTAWVSPFAMARLKADLIDTLHAQGFESAQVAVKTTPAGEKTDVELVVTEGPQDTVRSIQLAGNRRLKEAELRKLIKTEVNTPWDGSTAMDDEAALTAHYQDRGMASASVKASTAIEKSTGAVALTFTIVEGEVFTVGAVHVRGDALGAEKGLLKQLETKPGAVFSVATTRRDVQKLEARGPVRVIPDVALDAKKKRVDITFELAPK